MALGFNKELAEELCQTFPDKTPWEVVKLRNATQNSKNYAEQTELTKANRQENEETLSDTDGSLRDEVAEFDRASGET